MIRYLIVSLAGGVLFGALDGILNGNPLGQNLLEFFRPITRPALNFRAGILFDLISGFVLAGLFLLLQRSLPGGSGLVKGFSFGLLVWFLRVVMQAASNWVMFTVPVNTIFYMLGSGLVEMLILGIFFGLTLPPSS